MFPHLNHSKQAVNDPALHNCFWQDITFQSYETTGTDRMYFPKYTMLILIYDLYSPLCIGYELLTIVFTLPMNITVEFKIHTEKNKAIKQF